MAEPLQIIDKTHIVVDGRVQETGGQTTGVTSGEWDGRAVVAKAFDGFEPADETAVLLELWLLQKVQHRLVVAPYGLARNADRSELMIVMEPASSSLRHAMDAHLKEHSMPLPVSDVLGWAHDVTVALQHVHAKGVCHLDLKPANVLLFDNGDAKLADFGLSQVMSDGVAHNSGCGSAAYMAPEQWVDGSLVGAPADIYAFGVMLFELVTGWPPFYWLTRTNDKLLNSLTSTDLRSAVRDAVMSNRRRSTIRRPKFSSATAT
jgi:serine/threonine protein kinase